MTSARRSAFTLLEVLLTLLIASFVIAAISAALSFHLRVVDAGRAEVEQAQLARALLRRMGDDLRGAVPVAKKASTAASDTAAAATAAASSAAGSSTGGSSSSGSTGGSTGGTTGGSSGSSGSGSSGGSSSGSSSGSKSSSNSGSSSAGGSTANSAAAAATKAADTSASEEETTTQPNFVGTQYELQFDAGRLPGVQQFAAVSSDAAMSGALQPADTLSDVKTVSYYVGTATSTQPVVDPLAIADPAAAQMGGGLIRRELSRAASNFAYTQGGGAATSHERVLATEAAALEFHYYNGTEWLTDWDSSTNEALPICVEILLTLRTVAPTAGVDPLSLFAAPNQLLERSYRLVVHIPAAETSSTSDTTETSTTEAESTR